MKSILLYANEEYGREARVQAALDLARAQEGHVTCLYVTPLANGYVTFDPFGGCYAVPALIEELERQKTDCREHIEAKLNSEGVRWSWVERDGYLAQTLVDQSRLADVIVMTLPGTEGDGAPQAMSQIGQTIVHARPPILAVARRVRSFDCFGPAVVAWNGSSEASHALQAALPLLKLAKIVHLVEIEREPSAFPATQGCEYLSWHGIKPELHARPEQEVRLGSREVSDAIREEARRLGAAYIVMGGYGHSRFREAVLGGTTREMLEQEDVPLLIGH